MRACGKPCSVSGGFTIRRDFLLLFLYPGSHVAKFRGQCRQAVADGGAGTPEKPGGFRLVHTDFPKVQYHQVGVLQCAPMCRDACAEARVFRRNECDDLVQHLLRNDGFLLPLFRQLVQLRPQLLTVDLCALFDAVPQPLLQRVPIDCQSLRRFRQFPVAVAAGYVSIVTECGTEGEEGEEGEEVPLSSNPRLPHLLLLLFVTLVEVSVVGVGGLLIFQLLGELTVHRIACQGIGHRRLQVALFVIVVAESGGVPHAPLYDGILSVGGFQAYPERVFVDALEVV